MRSAAEGEHRTGEECLDGVARRRAILPERWAIGTRCHGAWSVAASKPGCVPSSSLSRAKVLTSPRREPLDSQAAQAARTVDLVDREGKRSAQRRQARRRQGWKPEGARPRSGLDAQHESPVPQGDAREKRRGDAGDRCAAPTARVQLLQDVATRNLARVLAAEGAMRLVVGRSARRAGGAAAAFSGCLRGGQSPRAGAGALPPPAEITTIDALLT